MTPIRTNETGAIAAHPAITVAGENEADAKCATDNHAPKGTSMADSRGEAKKLPPPGRPPGDGAAVELTLARPRGRRGGGAHV